MTLAKLGFRAQLISGRTRLGEDHPTDGDRDTVCGHMAFDLDHAAHASDNLRDRLEHGMRPRSARKLEGSECRHA
jgi:hypothetical protein